MEKLTDEKAGISITLTLFIVMVILRTTLTNVALCPTYIYGFRMIFGISRDHFRELQWRRGLFPLRGNSIPKFLIEEFPFNGFLPLKAKLRLNPVPAKSYLLGCKDV